MESKLNKELNMMVQGERLREMWMKGMPSVSERDIERKPDDELLPCTDQRAENCPKHFRPVSLEGVRMGREGSGEGERAGRKVGREKGEENEGIRRR